MRFSVFSCAGNLWSLVSGPTKDFAGSRAPLDTQSTLNQSVALQLLDVVSFLQEGRQHRDKYRELCFPPETTSSNKNASDAACRVFYGVYTELLQLVSHQTHSRAHAAPTDRPDWLARPGTDPLLPLKANLPSAFDARLPQGSKDSLILKQHVTFTSKAHWRPKEHRSRPCFSFCFVSCQV